MSRPKTGKAYEVLNCRVPPGLVDRLSDYAKLHNQRVRDVVAAALLAYLDGTPVAPLETGEAQMVRQAQQRIAEGLKMLGTVAQTPRRAPTRPPAVSVTPPSDNHGVDVTPQPDGTPAYDTTKYYLGKLCPGEHDWHGTGQTLKKRKGNKCRLCENAGKKTRRQAARQALEASSA